MRTLEENKMVTIEAGDWVTALNCAACGALIGFAIGAWELMLECFMTGNWGPLEIYGSAVIETCSACVQGGGE